VAVCASPGILSLLVVFPLKTIPVYRIPSEIKMQARPGESLSAFPRS